MNYNVGDKVNILANEGQVGTIIDRVADFIYLVGLTERCCSWEEEFHEDDLSLYENNTDRIFEKFKKDHPELYLKIVDEWKRKGLDYGTSR
jgi:hypothetical protein